MHCFTVALVTTLGLCCPLPAGPCGSSGDAPPAAASSAGKLPDLPVSLDGWLLSEDATRAAFHSLSADADISIIEGCLGMFDSPTPDASEQGSTAQVAGWLQAPLVLVIDAAAFGSVRAVIALIKGHTGVEGSVPVAAVILNKAPSKALAAELQEGLKQAGMDVAVLGAVPKVRQHCHASKQRLPPVVIVFAANEQLLGGWISPEHVWLLLPAALALSAAGG